MTQRDGDSSRLGLTEKQVEERLREDGPNALPNEGPKKWLRLLVDVLTEPMLLLLTVCAVLYLILGDISEAILLSVFVLFVIVVTVYQERRSENAMAALKKLAIPYVRVMRIGGVIKIHSHNLVRDDLLLLGEGDRIPADGFVIESTNFLVDESLLTGESVPVQKTAVPSSAAVPPVDVLQKVFSGTLVVRGHALVRVTETGIRTQMGQLGKSMAELDLEVAPLKKQIQKLVRIIVVASLAVCAVIFAVYSFQRHAWVKGLLASLSLAMSLLPEELPMILTIFFALGAWRMAQSKVLTRRAHAIETLGAATVLCVDKTGTLTYNKMQVHTVVSADERFVFYKNPSAQWPVFAKKIVYCGAGASQDRPSDPMDFSLKGLAQTFGDSEVLAEAVREYPMTPSRFAFVYARPKSPGGFYIAAKGAPEAIMRLCHMGAEQTQKWLKQIEELASQGLRVLGVAQANWDQSSLPEQPENFDFSWLGLLGFLDPIREEAQQTIEACHKAGIRVMMLTGDHPQTALAIAKEVGLSVENGSLTGVDIDGLSDDALKERLRVVEVCSRVSPQQKLRLVQQLKASGEIVAMTGDGVNDAPALKAAHIGIAMGERGTDVAREAAALILLDDHISSWVIAIQLGRRIFDNLKKALGYTLAVHLPIAGLSLVPALLGWPLVLFPAHIAMLEMIIDPVCSLVFEADPARKDVLTTPPRSQKEPILSRAMLLRSLGQGALLTLVGIFLLVWSRMKGYDDFTQRSMVFTSLVCGNLILIVLQRSWGSKIRDVLIQRNLPFWLVMGGALVVLACILYIPALGRLFHMRALSWSKMAFCLATLAATSLLLWGSQRLMERFAHPRKRPH